MEPRLNYPAAAPEAFKALRRLQDYVADCGLEHSLIELVKIRASQINGCAFCIHMHTRDARAAGESETRLYLLSAWRDSPLFTPRERAALAWTDALTRVAETQAPDSDYEELGRHFTEAEQVKLSLLIGVINIWNRLAIGFRSLHPVEEPV
ncbi:carboxymuconolactone decarboxylase family protein [Fodinicurvata halophila]|uniref:Carboxymuconolactone decarboxylase family protein n=1 Tax=Fodinicurvata halophila TaxID=1419723 RepID=A0ABV8UQ81_9PROT